MAMTSSPRPVRCGENEAVAKYLWDRWRAMADSSKGLSDNYNATFNTAYRNLCAVKDPIRSPKDLSQVKGVGKWLLRLMKGFFPDSSLDASTSKGVSPGKRGKGSRRYVPQKNSAAYALLITLYKEKINGKSFMKKQELIDAAEASGLSNTTIGQDRIKGKPGAPVTSGKDWYTGWSCMSTLVTKGLVVKASNPAKYMLTDEGQLVARDCLERSRLCDPIASIVVEPCRSPNEGIYHNIRNPAASHCHISQEMDLDEISIRPVSQDVEVEQLHNSDCDADSTELLTKCWQPKPLQHIERSVDLDSPSISCSASASPRSSTEIRACSFEESHALKACNKYANDEKFNFLALPPCIPGKEFLETYNVILILDDREHFGSRYKKVADSIYSQFKVFVEVRRLPVGDGIWVARDKQSRTEYVLDFIVERKRVDDLLSSIRDNRYRDQKIRLQRCGLTKLIYLVEGDPNALEAADSVKTACFTTEILEGFDIQRTSGYSDTVRRYGYLTFSIMQYYNMISTLKNRSAKACPSYDNFVRKCESLETMTVSDVFVVQLMQVPQVTEEAALAVIEMYPTVLSLARAYSLLEGDPHAQEEMLKNKNKAINAGASRNIFKLIWSE